MTRHRQLEAQAHLEARGLAAAGSAGPLWDAAAAPPAPAAAPPPRPAAAPDGFHAGLEGSQRSAARWTPDEVAAVDQAIRQLAAAGGDFTSDEVWRLVPAVPVTKGLAARLNAAARRGLILNTGQLRTAARGGAHDHGQRLTVWRGRA